MFDFRSANWLASRHQEEAFFLGVCKVVAVCIKNLGVCIKILGVCKDFSRCVHFVSKLDYFATKKECRQALFFCGGGVKSEPRKLRSE